MPTFIKKSRGVPEGRHRVKNFAILQMKSALTPMVIVKQAWESIPIRNEDSGASIFAVNK